MTEKWRKNRLVFVEVKGTREQIVNIRIIIEKCRDQNIPVYVRVSLTMRRHLTV